MKKTLAVSLSSLLVLLRPLGAAAQVLRSAVPARVPAGSAVSVVPAAAPTAPASLAPLSLAPTRLAADAAPSAPRALAAAVSAAVVAQPAAAAARAVPSASAVVEPALSASWTDKAVGAAPRRPPAAAALAKLGESAALRNPGGSAKLSSRLAALFDGRRGAAYAPEGGAVNAAAEAAGSPNLPASSPAERLTLEALASDAAAGLAAAARGAFAGLPEDRFYPGLPEARRFRAQSDLTVSLDASEPGGVRLTWDAAEGHAYPALSPAFRAEPGLRAFLRGLLERLPEAVSLRGVKASIKAARLEGAGALKGAHQDADTDFTAMWMVSRANASRSEVRLYADAEGLATAGVYDLEPGEVLLFDNKALWHETARPAAVEAGLPVEREMIVLQLSALAPAVEAAPAVNAPAAGLGTWAKAGLALGAAGLGYAALYALVGPTLMGTALWVWGGFIAFVGALLALDLGVFHKESKEASAREALAWTGVWFALAMAFDVGVGFTRGLPAAMEFLSGYLIEQVLSVDNLFVFISVFASFRVPQAFQRKVLFWGILGAAGLRLGMILGGGALLETFHSMTYVFGAILLWAAVKMAFAKDEGADPSKGLVFRLARRLLPIAEDYDGDRFTTRQAGRLLVTPLLVVLLIVEATDLVFALDSVPAIFAVTRDPFIAFTSNLFAVLGLRSLFFALAGMLDKFHRLKAGLAVVLAFVALKMLLAHVFAVPVLASLAVIVGVLAAAMAASVIWPKKP
ncbi:MAG: TerC/Alx family metal homeostasis membrane protein [Elusimicrobia bacterium]|nr:TerC/Alx family metal homeostasis membrane protein [Elusimicrobiota bacterium]